MFMNINSEATLYYLLAPTSFEYKNQVTFSPFFTTFYVIRLDKLFWVLCFMLLLAPSWLGKNYAVELLFMKTIPKPYINLVA